MTFYRTEIPASFYRAKTLDHPEDSAAEQDRDEAPAEDDSTT